MDNAFNGTRISILTVSHAITTLCIFNKIFQNNEYSGPNLLSKLKRLNKIFGRAILYGSGRIRSHFNFYGNNLGII